MPSKLIKGFLKIFWFFGTLIIEVETILSILILGKSFIGEKSVIGVFSIQRRSSYLKFFKKDISLI